LHISGLTEITTANHKKTTQHPQHKLQNPAGIHNTRKSHHKGLTISIDSIYFTTDQLKQMQSTD